MLRFSHLAVIGSTALLAGLVACSTPDVTSADADLEGSHTGVKKDVSDKNTDHNNENGTTNTEQETNSNTDNSGGLDPNATDTKSCTDECTGGTKRCSLTSNSTTELCVKASDGCNRWIQSTECASDAACDRAKNDGTCKAGCINDNGCSATNVGTRRCSPNGTAEETCQASGSCFVFKTTRTNILQECTGTGNFCSFGARKTCVASQVGTCMQHAIASNPCASGTTCSGGQCISTCTNDVGCSASTVNAERCAPIGSRSKQRCARGTTDSCYHWTATTSCSPDETCTGTGNCG